MSVFKRDFLSFSTTTLSYFSHIILSFPLLYQSSRDLCCESVFCDKSVKIIQVFIFVFEEANLRVRIVTSSCESSV